MGRMTFMHTYAKLFSGLTCAPYAQGFSACFCRPRRQMVRVDWIYLSGASYKQIANERRATRRNATQFHLNLARCVGLFAFVFGRNEAYE